MNYIDLDRQFVPLKKGEEPTLDYSPHWGRRVGGWLNWADLLQRRRVALLAEALSGKTWELANRVKVLRDLRKPAFFVRIEDLADGGFQAALNAEDVDAFQAWKDSSGDDAWFFLDSVDEARLNHKSIPNALRAFKNELGAANLNRAYVFISCRASDWKGIADVQAIQTELPFEEPSRIPIADVEEELLAPIFQADRRQSVLEQVERPLKANELLVVQLVPLSAQQKSLMAAKAGIDGQSFLENIRQSGLESMSERPGDLLELLEYWSEHRCFASLQEMMASSVDRKLRELNPDRGGAGLLSLKKAREGAQRLAGALTLVQTFSIKGPLQEPDPALAKGALDASVVLDDWSPDHLGALLRTGLFAPSSYGRIKFHHRGTQEYLAARWLNALLEANLPVTEVRQLLFADRYGVATAVTSLLPITAWLSLWNERIREELARREPVALIAHGDAKSIPLQTKQLLLKTYAALDARGELDAEQVSYRAAWMFAVPELGTAIHQAWRVNQRHDFRLQLLMFILEGRLKPCADIAREAATSGTEPSHVRLVATQALDACGDTKGLKQVANLLRASPNLFGLTAAPAAVDVLFPRYLSIRDVIQLVDQLRSDDKYAFESFGRHLADIHRLAPDRGAKADFVEGIAEIASRGGLSDGIDDKGPKRRGDLDEGLAGLILAELLSAGAASPSLILLMMVLERASHLVDGEQDLAAVKAAVRRIPSLNRELMWANEKLRRRSDKTYGPPTRHFQIGPFMGRSLWSVEIEDADWLAHDVISMPDESQRRIAFSALWTVYRSADRLESHWHQLESLAGREAAIQSDLAAFESPPPSDPLEPDVVARQAAMLKKNEDARKSWLEFRLKVAAQPTMLSESKAVKTWKGGIFRLWHITHWIERKSRRDGLSGMQSWRAVEDVFGPEVLAHYLIGVSAAWRNIRPERPIFTGANTYNVKYISTLAVNAIELETLVQADWPTMLSPRDIELGAKHLLMTNNVRLPSFERLAQSRPELVKPILINALRAELRSGGRLHDVLSFAAHTETSTLRNLLAEEVLAQLKRREPGDKDALAQCVGILKKAATMLPSKSLRGLAQKRAAAHLVDGDQERAFNYLSLLSVLDGEALATTILAQLAQRADESDAAFKERVGAWLGAAFDHRGRGYGLAALSSMPVALLTELNRLAYRHIPPSKDRSSGIDVRADPAEGAKTSLLEALLQRSGPQAHAAFLQLSTEADFSSISMRLKELAHRKAQMDSDLTPWTAAEVHAFEKRFAAPVKNGPHFMGVAQGILDEIADGLRTRDASSRQLLAKADNEQLVQEWLAERLEDKSRSRYSTHREVEVASGNEPDITLASHAAPVEVAIEVKNANMGWTIKDLEVALTVQLAQKYLLPEKRRHGILVISLHENRTWRSQGRIWSFKQVIEHLQARARRIVSNRTGDIEVAVVALDATTA